jgi:hypothetical protein
MFKQILQKLGLFSPVFVPIKVVLSPQQTPKIIIKIKKSK